MPLTPEQEWTLVACGLVAHADGVLKEGECDQVLAMIDERLSPGDQEAWVNLLASREALLEHVKELPPILPLFHEPILERAWAMALADGEVGDTELRVVEEIASMVGADLDDLASWRDQWTAEAALLAEHKASFAALLIHRDGTIDEAEAVRYEALLEQMPVSSERRRAFAAFLETPPSIDHVGARLASLPRDRRVEVLRAIAPLVDASQRADVGREFFLELAHQAGIDPVAAERMLDV
ncbi:MAG: TerB family tellurite resistance protein [Myxococcales bacterium]|nr:TerB family tellurite resistance protein [Myxococcales bacterium]